MLSQLLLFSLVFHKSLHFRDFKGGRRRPALKKTSRESSNHNLQTTGVYKHGPAVYKHGPVFINTAVCFVLFSFVFVLESV
mgnify:CR=1 FL=1